MPRLLCAGLNYRQDQGRSRQERRGSGRFDPHPVPRALADEDLCRAKGTRRTAHCVSDRVRIR